MYVNINYVNPAVKFRYPNAIELRPLKCCICPKLTPGLKNFEHENACFVHLVTMLASSQFAQPLKFYILDIETRDCKLSNNKGADKTVQADL